jgi:hypothetical protein
VAEPRQDCGSEVFCCCRTKQEAGSRQIDFYSREAKSSVPSDQKIEGKSGDSWLLGLWRAREPTPVDGFGGVNRETGGQSVAG